MSKPVSIKLISCIGVVDRTPAQKKQWSTLQLLFLARAGFPSYLLRAVRTNYASGWKAAKVNSAATSSPVSQELADGGT